MHHPYQTAPSYSPLKIPTIHRPMPYYPYSINHYTPYIPLPPEPNVLDLSKKTSLSPNFSRPSLSPQSLNNSLSPPRPCESISNCQLTPPLSHHSDTTHIMDHSSLEPKSPSSASASSETRSELSESSVSPKSNASRPFKILPKDSLTLALQGISHIDPSSLLCDQELGAELTKELIEDSVKKYNEFRKRMLEQLQSPGNVTNSNMRRVQNNADKIQDSEYLEKRRKNNEAAKRSRDARKNKQDEIAIRMAFLEQENLLLKFKIKTEEEHLDRLKNLVQSRK
ncbi:thyrotroph embryonic factor-like [Sitophilus oryzae]|uniref:Thyrotroph embryonic factor-like n=1 Tax=Sitophilus oryzae TaxID=7048 RepID=A0A6J2YQJ8_SITOR|nr:thyrotroph embryonic factor-like [Sitophilus oryzae]